MNVTRPIQLIDVLESLRPNSKWVISDGVIEWADLDQSEPTKAEIDAELARLSAQQVLEICKDEAKKRIATTDWSVLPDVGISNTAEFEAYRAALRELIKNPVAEPVWPTEPQPVWS